MRVLAAIGNSNEPGTQTISTWSLNSEVSKPCLFKQSRQPDRILFVIKSLNLATTIPTFKVDALVNEPSKIAFKFYFDILYRLSRKGIKFKLMKKLSL